eukprot:CAMPEP_0181527002 /NCGR_PEP_ID=MMETSP1110-20121109/69776_1 /TAXON_ID=174948 /ORGANISM="Symbiodinium sp., Strain CCMP421" /LENGTH=97 /DNA_ID=CAMNT_0023657859 /DNA_START=45 /DNA_END=335 /DNA_ORIENTATION=-
MKTTAGVTSRARSREASKRCAVSRFQMKGNGKEAMGLKIVWCGTSAKVSSMKAGRTTWHREAPATTPPNKFEGGNGNAAAFALASGETRFSMHQPRL